MEIRELKKIPHELYQGRIIIQVEEGKSTVCQVRRVYPDVDVEVAINSAMLTQGASEGTEWYAACYRLLRLLLQKKKKRSGLVHHTGRDINLPFSQHTSDGYYECPFALAEQARFTTSFSVRDLFLLWVADWQTYAQQQGYRAVKYNVLADGGMVDSTTGDPEEAITLYESVLGHVHILRLYVQLYLMEGDAEPREEIELLGSGEYDDLF